MPNNDSQQIFLKPIKRAYSDLWLQIKAQPLSFFLIWLFFSLLPPLLFGFVIQNVFSGDTMSFLLTHLSSGGDPSLLNTEDLALLRRLLIGILLVYLLFFVIAVFQGASLASLIKRLRTMDSPHFLPSLQDAKKIFLGYLKTVLRVSVRILGLGSIGLLAGFFLGLLIGKPLAMLIPAISTGLMLGFLFFGLAPFFHLAGLGARYNVLQASRAYYRVHRATVTAFFFIAILFPIFLVSFLGSLIIGSSFISIGMPLVNLLGSLAFYVSLGAYINFGNNENEEDEEKTGKQKE